MPIYFVSKALSGSELNYLPIGKLVYAHVVTARRLRRYFQAHLILILTDQPIRQLLYKPEISGRLTKWAIELGEHEIAYYARRAIKGQVMADYLAETAADMLVICNPEQLPAPSLELWELYTDGAASSEGAGAGLILTVPHQEEHTYALRFNFKVTNNELVSNQTNGTFDANDKSMQSYLALVHSLADTFVDFKISQIPRSQNKQADVLSKLVALTFNHLENKILVEQVFKKSTELETTISSVEEEEATWMTDIIEFLWTGSFLEGEKEAMKIRVKAPNYELRGEILYRKSYLGVSLCCVGPKEAAMIIDEVHKGSCGLHSGWRTVIERIKRLGYYWPRMYADTAERIRVCQECQLHAPVSRAPQHPMIPITSSWPFCKWDIDIVGPFPKGARNAEYLVVTVDFFTKWVEAKPLCTITSKQIRDFFWESIVCRFGVPNKIVSDNGTQFEGKPFRSRCQDLNIKQRFTSVVHPQANGQSEVTNRDIVHSIKARTTHKNSTGETPFSLVYSLEVVIPAEITVPKERILSYREGKNDERLRTNLNYAEERREMATIREAANKQCITKYYDKRVRARTYKVGDLVWHDNQANRAQNTGKLGPNWEGPYKVIGISNTGTYKLADLKGNPIKRTWQLPRLKNATLQNVTRVVTHYDITKQNYNLESTNSRAVTRRLRNNSSSWGITMWCKASQASLANFYVPGMRQSRIALGRMVGT
ncbi:uncharacterized protein [Rutidosis leptorrhynchoides]|uniref:uncharacterized protein n=1 Tax=Rutidosis leptorrhynchoides TaxID=125765 RepID=UPI003A98D976